MSGDAPLKVWLVEFDDGQKLTYLTHDCQTADEAHAASIERFGNRIKEVKENPYHGMHQKA